MAATCRHKHCAHFARINAQCAELGVITPDHIWGYGSLGCQPRGPTPSLYRLQGLFDFLAPDPQTSKGDRNCYNLPTFDDPVSFLTALLSEHTKQVVGPVTTGTIHALRQSLVDATMRDTGPLAGKLSRQQMNNMLAALAVLTPTPTHILESRTLLDQALQTQTHSNLRAAITAGIVKGVDCIRDKTSWVRDFFTDCKSGLAKGIKAICLGLAAHFEDAQNSAQTASDFLGVLKPVTLSMIIKCHNNTPAGWVVTLTALRELYGCSTSDLGQILTQLVELFMNVAQEAWSLILKLAGYTLQSIDLVGFAVVAMCGLYFICTGSHCTKSIIQRFKSILGGVITLASAVRAFQYFMELVHREEVNRKVTKFMVRVAAFIDATKIKDLKASEAQEVFEFADVLICEGQSLLTDNIGPLVPLVQSALRDVANHRVNLQALVEANKRQEPPKMYVFCGPPGIGKTTLVNALIKDLGVKSSAFSLMIDHHDHYTGEDVAVWDEFDTDPKQAFVQTVISMVNTVPMPLNCDRVENKGRCFTSKLILATTNNETPLQPNDPRYAAFMRRVTYIDVSAERISDCYNNGRKPNPSLFKADYSHLTLMRRCAMAYNSAGNLPNGKCFGPTPITYSKLLADLKVDLASFKLQGPEWEGLWIKCVKPHHVPGVTEYFNCVFKHLGSPNRVVTTRTLSEVGFYDVIVTTESPPAGSKFHEVVIEGFRTMPDCVRDPYDRPLSMFDFRGTPSQTLLNTAINQVRGHMVITSTQPVDVSKLPRPRRIATIDNWYGLIKAAFAHCTLFTPFALMRMVRNGATLTQGNVEEFFRNVTKDVRFSGNPECTLIRGPLYDILFFTCGGSCTWILPGRMPVAGLGPIGDLTVPTRSVVSCTLTQAIGMALNSLVNFLKPYVGVFATSLALSTVWGTTLQKKKGKNKKGGFRALSDEEYQEYLDIQRDWRQKMTVDEYLDVVANPDSDYVERYAAWSRLRGLRMANNAYNHATVTVGRDGMSWEVQGPSATVNLTADDGTVVGFANRIGQGVFATCTHLLDMATAVDGVPFTQMQTVGDCTLIRQQVPTPGPHYRVSQTTQPRAIGVAKHPVTTIGQTQKVVSGVNIVGWKVTTEHQTHSGDCGTPYFDSEGALVGLHSASANVGNIKLVSRVVPQKQAQEVHELTWKDLQANRSEPTMGPLPGSTKYHKSFMHFDCGFEPANFGPCDQRCPKPLTDVIASQLRPYQEQPPHINEELLGRGVRHVRAFLRHILGTHRRKQIDLVSAFKSLNMKSSNGPWFPGCKRDYTMDDGAPNALLHNYIESKIIEMKRGDYTHAYKLSLKDELRPSEKVRAGKRRLLWGCDVALSTVCAMVFKQLFDDFAAAAPCVGSCVGIDMDNVATVKLLNTMFTGTHVVCADYSQWDSTLHPRVIEEAVDTLLEFVDNTDLCVAVRNILVSRPRGLVFDISVPTFKGLPSGMPGTSIINSVCHLILFACSVLDCYARVNAPYHGNVFSNERVVVYGDDCVYGWTTATASMATQFWNTMRSFGMKPTNPTKDGDPAFTDTIQFLKRTIVLAEGTLVAALEKSSLERQLCWIKGPKTTTMEPIYPPDPEVRLMQIQNAVWRAAAHGPEYFEKFEQLATELCKRELLPYAGTKYSEAIELITNISSIPPDGEAIVYVMEGPEGSMQKDVPQAQTQVQLADGVQSSTSGPPVLVTPSPPNTGAQAVAAAAATGVLADNVPPEVKGTFCVAAYYTWNSRAAPNTLIGFMRLGPECNPYTDHISQMFGGWSGSMLIRLSISGSGIFAGKVLGAILPPGVNAEDVGEPGAFPHVILDAKTTIAFSVPVYDIRNVDYHLRGDTVVSTFGLWVYQPLINPFAAGDATAVITIETTPGPDFRFCLLRPPTTVDRTRSPHDLLPRNLVGALENRFNNPPDALVLVQAAYQVNHHYDVHGTTHGWSTVPLGPPQINIRGVDVNTNGPWHGFRVEPVAGTDIVRPGIPNHWPDSCASSTINGGANAYTGVGAGGLAMQVSHNDVDEGAPLSVKYCVFGGTAQPLAPNIADNNLVVQRLNGANLDNNRTDAVTTLSFVVKNADANPDINEKVTPIGNENPVFGPIGGNLVALWRAPLRCTHRDSQVYSSQLVETAIICAQGRSVPDGSMAVFTFNNRGEVFQVGVCPDGYLRTGGAPSQVVLLDPDVQIEYNGLYSVNTPLPGPHGNTGGSYRMRE
uniref:Genome polyprotein n=1 Tax=Porcine sapovirus TaxID=1454551 RepID=A0A455WA33_9CALI|nr:polyprotein [Porcine sapovirus]